MAKVVKKGARFCVAHDRTGAVLKRKGKAVCFKTRRAANNEAANTKCRVMGVCRAKSRS